jgi:hypothetical protein
VARYSAGPGQSGGGKNLRLLSHPQHGRKWFRAMDGQRPRALAVGGCKRAEWTQPHKVTRLNDFKILGALSRNFFGTQASTSPRSHEDGRPTGPVSFRAWTKRGQDETVISPRETKRFASRVVSRWNLYGRRISHFAVLFVFNGLTPFSLRRFLVVTEPHSVRFLSMAPSFESILRS